MEFQREFHSNRMSIFAVLLAVLAVGILLGFAAGSAKGAWSTSITMNNAISTATGDQVNPQLVSDGSGGMIIIWEDYRSGTSYDIYAQRINSTGTVQWTENGTAISTATDNQDAPQLVSDGSGGAIIAWQDKRGGTYYDIYAQRINSAGTVQWTANGTAISTATNTQSNPQLDSDGSGGAIITWQDKRGGTYYDIYAQRINSAGTIQWTANGVAICTATNDQNLPQIVSDGSGGAVIAWQDYRSSSFPDIYAQRINSMGTVQWTANGVAICTESSTQFSPQLDSDGSGGAIITWYDYRNSGTTDIYAQRINSAGTVQWTANGVAICTATDSQDVPQLVSDGSGGAIITWRDYRSGTSYDTYAQRINSAGTVQWTANGMAISTATGSQSKQQLASDGSGGAIITWHDYRNGGSADIYAQLVCSVGTLGKPITVDDSGGADYTTIQDAVNASIAGDTIYIYNGTYYVNWTSGIAISKSINLVGQDNRSTILQGTGASNSKCLYITANYVGVSNLKIYNFYYGIHFNSASNNNITGNTITNSVDSAIMFDAYSNNNDIISNTITSIERGIVIASYSSGNNIKSNRISNCGTYGISFYSTTTDNNNITANDICGNKQYGIYVSTIGTGNTAYNNWWGSATGPYNAASNPSGTGDNITNGIAFSPWATAQFIKTTLYVNAAGGADYTTIQDAVNASIAGDTIYVYNGTYYVNSTGGIAISKSIHLVGQDNQSVIIQGTGALNSYGLYVTANYANISNMKINNFYYGIYLSSGSNNTIYKNTVANCGYLGIFLGSNSNNNTITGNTVTNCVYFGIIISASSNNNVTSNTISFNDKGIYFSSNSNYNNVTSNTIANCSKSINIDVSINTNATLNNIYDNTNYGLYYNSGTGNTAYNNWWGNATGPYNAASNSGGTGDNITDGIPFSPWAARPFGSSGAMTFYVNAAGGADYTTIQDAVNASIAGDTVYVYNGTYYVNWSSGIAISKSISIVGESNQNTILQGKGTGGSTGISITANYVNISNLKINNFYYGIYLTTSSNNNITLNTITNSSSFAIVLFSTSTGSNYNNITSNAFMKCDVSIYLYSSSNNNILSNTIENSSSNSLGSIYLYHGSSSNTIASNTITNSSSYGIYLNDQSNYNNITSNIITNNTQRGIIIASSSNYNNVTSNTISNSGYGILLTSSQYNNLSSNIVSNCGSFGIYLSSISDNNTITSNTVTNTGTYDIYISSSSNNTITSNTVTSSGTYGIFIYSSSNSNTITSNTVTITGSSKGVYLYTSSNNNVTSNTISNCGTGFNFYSSSNNAITSNTITNCNDGFYLDGASNNNNISGNTITSIARGIVFASSSSSNSIMSNRISNCGTYGISFYSASINNNNITANDIVGNKQYGVYVSNIGTGNTAYNNWWGRISGPYNAASNPNGKGDNITDGVPFSPWATRPFGGGAITIYVNAAGGADYTTIQDAVNASIAGDTVYVYNGTYYVNWTGGIEISKSINLTGESNQSTMLQGTRASNSKGFNVTANYVNISNLKIDNFEYGIYLKTGSNNNTITSNTVTNCTYGIYIYSSSNNNSITTNTVTNSGNYGIYIYSSSNNNSITSNTITSSGNGIFYSSSNNNSITSNTVTNSSSYGIYLYSSSNNNITSNTITNSGDDGIYLDYSSNNNITSNTITNSTQHGIRLQTSSNYNSISSNILWNNPIFADASLATATIQNNTADGLPVYFTQNVDSTASPTYIANSTYGQVLLYNVSGFIIQNNSFMELILIFNSNQNVIASNTITNSNQYGIYIQTSSNNNITSNTITNCSGNGIYIYSSSNNNTITSNTVTNSSSYGIYIQSASNYNNITSNTVTNNSYGIYLLLSSNYNNITSNTVTNNSYGIHIFFSSNYNNITSNTVTNNSNHGIRLTSSSNNNITTNNIYGNKQYGLFVTTSSGSTAYNNWWGNASGPYNAASNPSGTGDNISNSVPFSPWLTATVGMPNAPTITTTAYTDADGTYSINWTASNYATNYLIEENSSVIFNATNSSLTYAFIGKADGNYSYRIAAWNINGTSDWSGYVNITVDTSAPQTTLVGAVNNVWSAANLTINLSATDINGVACIIYRIYNTSWTDFINYTGNFTLSEGIHYLEFNATDAIGNVEATHNFTIKIDLTVPTVQSAVFGTDGANGWKISTSYIMLTAADNISGVQYLNYSVNNQSFQPYTNITLSASGTYYIRYYVVDYASLSSGESNITVYVDVDAPTTTPVVSGTTGNGTWYVNDVNMTLSAADSASGVASTQMNIDSGGWIAYAPTNLTEGAHTIYYRSTDAAGNVESNKTLNISIDKTNPTTSIDITGTVGSNGYYITNATVALTGSDSPSGIAHVYHDLDNAGWSEYSSQIVLTSSTVSGHILKHKAVDNAGNTGNTTTTTIKVDTIVPDSVGVLSGTLSNGWYRSSVTVNISVLDAESGLAGVKYQIDSNNWVTYTTGITTEFIVSGEGNHTVKYYGTDNASNIEPENTLTFKIDTVKPVSSYTLTGQNGTNGWFVSNVTVALSGTDATSGVNKIQYCLSTGGGNQTYGNTTYNSPFTVSTAGIYALWYWAQDNATNLENTNSITIKIDKNVPSTSTATHGMLSNTGWYVSSVSLNLSTTDDLSGVNNITYQINGTSFVNYIGNVSITEDGYYTIIYQAYDIAGNAESQKTIWLNVSATPPNTTYAVLGTNSASGWYISGIQVTIYTSTGSISGIHHTNYSVNNASFATFQQPFWLNASGVYFIQFYSVTNASVQEETKNFTLNVDIDAPTTTANISQAIGNNSWYTQAVSVNMSATDANSGLSYTEYKLDSASWITGTIVNVSIDGTHTLLYRSKDVAGNTESANTLSLKLDTNAPETIFTLSGTLSTAQWYTTNVTITVTASDAYSGPNSTYVKVDSGNWELYNNQITITTSGTHTIYAYSFDNAGNQGTVNTTTLKIDQEYPVSQAQIGEGTKEWYTSNVTVYLNVTTTPTSGINATKYRLDSGTLTTYTNPILISTNGQHQIEYYSIGNNTLTETSKLLNFMIDKETPTVTATVAGTLINGWYATPAMITISATDMYSGVSKINYSLDGAVEATYTATITINTSGSHTITYYATDNASNRAQTQSRTLKVDVTGPTTNISITGTQGSNGYYTSNVLIQLAAYDTYSGLSSILYTINNGTATAYASLVNMPQDGFFNLTYWSVDNCSNAGTMTTVYIKIDKTAPIGTITINNGNGYTNNRCVAIAATYPDATSGVATAELSEDQSTWTNYSTPFTLSAGDGTKTVYLRVTDAAGNSITKSTDIILDTTKPTSSAIISGTPENSGWYHTLVNISMTSTDTIYYSINNGSLLQYTAAIALTADGTYFIKYYGMDSASNAESEKNITVKVDTEKPVTTLEVQGETTRGIYLTAIVNLNAVDASGVEYTKYRIGDTQTWSVYQAPLNLADGTYYVEWFSIDKSGWYEDLYNITMTVDSNANKLPSDVIAVNYTTDLDVLFGLNNNSAIANNASLSLQVNITGPSGSQTVFYNATTGNTTWNPEDTLNGDYTFNVTVKDALNRTATITKTVTVNNNPLRNMTFTGSANGTVVYSGQPVPFSIEVRNYNNVNSSFKFALYDNGQLTGYWNNGSTMNLMPLGKGSVTFWYIPTSSVAQHKFTVKMIEASTGAVVGEKSFESQVDMKVTQPAASQDYITTFVLPLFAILAIALAVVAVMLLRNKGMNTPKKKSEEKKLPPRK